MSRSTVGAPIVLFLLAAVSNGQSRRGTVCVAPNSAEKPTRFSSGREYNPATLSLKIDKRPPILWPHNEIVQINELDLNDRHLFTLKSDGKPIQSFWFSFSEFTSTDLCIAFDGYLDPQLREAERAPWCKRK
jgi:hypothetical protein